MRPVPLLVAAAMLATAVGKDAKPPAGEPDPKKDKDVFVLDPLKVHEKPIIAYAVDIAVYADPATKLVSRIFITRVHPDTDAARAGLQAGDEIVAVDGVPMKGLDATVGADTPLGRIFLNREPGTPSKFEIATRRTQEFTLRAQRGRPWARP